MNKCHDFSKIQLQGLLSVVDLILEKNKTNYRILFELRNFFINFGLSFRDKTYTELLLTEESNKKLICSISDSLESILKFYHDNSKLINLFIFV